MFNSNGINEIKRICQTGERKCSKHSAPSSLEYKEAITTYNKAHTRTHTQFRASKYEELTLFFNNTITSIRAMIAADVDTDNLIRSCKKDVIMRKLYQLSFARLPESVTPPPHVGQSLCLYSIL